MAAGENRFALELNEKEVIEPLEDLSNSWGAFLITKRHDGLASTLWFIISAVKIEVTIWQLDYILIKSLSKHVAHK